MPLPTASAISSVISLFDSNDKPTVSLPPPSPTRGHRRARSTVDLPPLFTRTPSASPTRSPSFLPFGRRSRDQSPDSRISAPSTHENLIVNETQRKIKPGTVGKIASWFEGGSEPVNISFIPSPKKEITDPFYQLDRTKEDTDEDDSTMANLTQRPKKPSLSGLNSANSSRFNFFKRAPTQTKIEPDELIHMDIRDALLPDGPVEEITPAAFKSLQLSAEHLLRKFQMSYAENLGALRQAISEKTIQADELEAARTRSEHLKLQLLDMAEKAAEQERIIASLKSQLAVPQPSVRMISDDEPITHRIYNHRSRRSDVSSSNESFADSDISSAVSVFSEVDSIGTPPSSSAGSPMMRHASLYKPTLIQGSSVQPHVTPILVTQCQKCHDVPTSEAWDVIEMMKMENAGLKERVAELELAQDSALDFLTTLKF